MEELEVIRANSIYVHMSHVKEKNGITRNRRVL